MENQQTLNCPLRCNYLCYSKEDLIYHLENKCIKKVFLGKDLTYCLGNPTTLIITRKDHCDECKKSQQSRFLTMTNINQFTNKQIINEITEDKKKQKQQIKVNHNKNENSKTYSHTHNADINDSMLELSNPKQNAYGNNKRNIHTYNNGLDDSMMELSNQNHISYNISNNKAHTKIHNNNINDTMIESTNQKQHIYNNNNHNINRMNKKAYLDDTMLSDDHQKNNINNNNDSSMLGMSNFSHNNEKKHSSYGNSIRYYSVNDTMMMDYREPIKEEPLEESNTQTTSNNDMNDKDEIIEYFNEDMIGKKEEKKRKAEMNLDDFKEYFIN
jgi:hypothetical protein